VRRSWDLSSKKMQKNENKFLKKNEKLLAVSGGIRYSLGMENYKGFEFDYQQGFITFYHPDMEEGNGDWSGSAATLEDAYEIIDEMTFEDN
jgi:hypothetical protein